MRHIRNTALLCALGALVVMLASCGGSESSGSESGGSGPGGGESGRGDGSSPAEGSSSAGTFEPIAPELDVPYEGTASSRQRLAAIEGRDAPALDVSSWMNSRGMTLEALRGEVVLLDFWGQWCPPCRALTPTMRRLWKDYHDRGLWVIGVHTNNDRSDELKGRRYVNEHGIEYPIAFDKPGNPTARSRYLVDGYPDLFLIDHRGVLRYADLDNSAPIRQLESVIEALLAERERDRRGA